MPIKYILDMFLVSLWPFSAFQSEIVKIMDLFVVMEIQCNTDLWKNIKNIYKIGFESMISRKTKLAP